MIILCSWGYGYHFVLEEKVFVFKTLIFFALVQLTRGNLKFATLLYLGAGEPSTKHDPIYLL